MIGLWRVRGAAPERGAATLALPWAPALQPASEEQMNARRNPHSRRYWNAVKNKQQLSGGERRSPTGHTQQPQGFQGQTLRTHVYSGQEGRISFSPHSSPLDLVANQFSEFGEIVDRMSGHPDRKECNQKPPPFCSETSIKCLTFLRND
ncbi:hypothetical protein SKAU_G00089380 [Synaphobranchus kaupii]|uniref:Uncharacterized protein n=1 Tax=Synaphobranchus kaupii TaxID=118154 RepID=A0A9Q1J457_SYNKA|nr:hypothetical protein SKAU_G00089380 [Synaphobranchus kaupii]